MYNAEVQIILGVVGYEKNIGYYQKTKRQREHRKELGVRQSAFLAS